MVGAVGQTDLADERSRARSIVVVSVLLATSVGISTFSSDGALRQQAVILENEADLLVAKRRQMLAGSRPNGLRPSSATVPDVGGSSAPRM